MQKHTGYTARPVRIKGQTVPEGTLVEFYESSSNQGGWVVKAQGIGSRVFSILPVR